MIDDRLALGEFTDLDAGLVILWEPHRRRDDAFTIPSRDGMRLARLVDEGDDGVRRAEIDPDHLPHGSHVRAPPCSVSGSRAGPTSTLALTSTSPWQARPRQWTRVTTPARPTEPAMGSCHPGSKASPSDPIS